MTIPVWPITLPTELLQKGYSQSERDIVIKSSMDIGPSKIRRRTTAGVEQVIGNLKLSESQLEDLRDFYTTDLLGGSLRFSWKDPVNLSAKEFRFTSPVKWTMTSGWYDVVLELEILP